MPVVGAVWDSGQPAESMSSRTSNGTLAPMTKGVAGKSLADCARRALDWITTGTFTRDAEFEAARDGTNHIELIDGPAIVDLMQEYESD
jgi:restriction endonuclease Mrr